MALAAVPRLAATIGEPATARARHAARACRWPSGHAGQPSAFCLLPHLRRPGAQGLPTHVLTLHVPSRRRLSTT